MYRKCYRYQDPPLTPNRPTPTNQAFSKDEEVILVPVERVPDRHAIVERKREPDQIHNNHTKEKKIPNTEKHNEQKSSLLNLPFDLKSLIKDGKILGLINIDDLIIILILLMMIEEESDDIWLMLALVMILCT